MKQVTAYIILVGTILLTITYMFDLYEMYFNDKFYEGYIYAVKIFLFDIIMIFPLIITLVIKNKTEFKFWAILSILLQNCVLIMGFEEGAIYAVGLGFVSTIVFVRRGKKFNLNESVHNNI